MRSGLASRQMEPGTKLFAVLGGFGVVCAVGTFWRYGIWVNQLVSGPSGGNTGSLAWPFVAVLGFVIYAAMGIVVWMFLTSGTILALNETKLLGPWSQSRVRLWSLAVLIPSTVLCGFIFYPDQTQRIISAVTFGRI